MKDNVDKCVNILLTSSSDGTVIVLWLSYHRHHYLKGLSLPPEYQITRNGISGLANVKVSFDAMWEVVTGL
jgi:hypothetical protein